jgi:hypothetical protein
MQLIKRLPLVVPIVLVAQLVFVAVASAQFQPGNGLLAAGNYHITTLSADYFSCCGNPSLPTVSVSVTDTTTVANPLVGPSTLNHETDVDMFACGGTPFICGSGCFIAGASDFTSNGLSSAMLTTAFDPATSLACDNRPVSFPKFTVNVNWSGTSPIGSTRKTSTYSCAGYNAEVQTLSSNDHATASASFSLAGGALPTDSAGLGTIDQRWHAQGVAQDACQSFGLGGVGGKGAGPGGPTGSGGFEFTNQSAGFSIPGPFGFPQAFVSLFSFNNVSRPTGTPPSTTGETELTVGSFGFPSFVDCFVLQSPNTFSFGSGLSGAAVHAVINHTTRLCPKFPNDPFTDFTVDLTWTPTGPLASIQSTAISDCGAFHQELLTTDTTNPASASGNVTAFTDPNISSTQASIGSSDHHFQDMGVTPQGCIVLP